MSDLVIVTHIAIWSLTEPQLLSTAATALHLNLPLITADHQIHAAGIQTIW
jgi:PIN domain nuclease of toxin-antitoxin system